MNRAELTTESGIWSLAYKCPACGIFHCVPVSADGIKHPGEWVWNNSLSSPTLTPSVRHFVTRTDGKRDTVCHYFIRGGRIDFCADSPHRLAGQVVDLPAIESSVPN